MIEPLLGASLASTISWLIQAEPTTELSGNLFQQLSGYGFVGLVVGLVILGVNHFNKREDKQEEQHTLELASLKSEHKEELVALRAEMATLKIELERERADRKNQEVQYQSQINLLQQEVADLKAKLAVAEIKLAQKKDM